MSGRGEGVVLEESREITAFQPRWRHPGYRKLLNAVCCGKQRARTIFQYPSCRYALDRQAGYGFATVGIGQPEGRHEVDRGVFLRRHRRDRHIPGLRGNVQVESDGVGENSGVGGATRRAAVAVVIPILRVQRDLDAVEIPGKILATSDIDVAKGLCQRCDIEPSGVNTNAAPPRHIRTIDPNRAVARRIFDGDPAHFTAVGIGKISRCFQQRLEVEGRVFGGGETGDIGGITRRSVTHIEPVAAGVVFLDLQIETVGHGLDVDGLVDAAPCSARIIRIIPPDQLACISMSCRIDGRHATRVNFELIDRQLHPDIGAALGDREDFQVFELRLRQFEAGRETVCNVVSVAGTADADMDVMIAEGEQDIACLSINELRALEVRVIRQLVVTQAAQAQGNRPQPLGPVAGAGAEIGFVGNFRQFEIERNGRVFIASAAEGGQFRLIRNRSNAEIERRASQRLANRVLNRVPDLRNLAAEVGFARGEAVGTTCGKR